MTYLISFDVGDTTALGNAATDMDTLASAASDLDEAPALDLEVGNLEDLPTDIDEVGTSLEELPIEDTGTRWGGLSDVLGRFGLASIGVGEAIQIATGAFEAGRQAWDFFTADAREAERRTTEFGEALLRTSGLIDGIEATFAESTAPADAFTQAFLDLEDVDLATTIAALGDVGLQADDLGDTLIALGTTDDPLQLLRDMADAAGIASDNIGIASLSGNDFATALGDVTDEQQTFLDGFNRLVSDLDGLNFDDIAEQQLEVAEGFDAMAVAQARANLGEDATDIEVWNEYQRIITEATAATEAETAAEEDLQAQQAALTDGARELSTALGSIEWENAELSGATTAMAAFSNELFGVDNATQSVEEAFARFASAVGDDPLNLDVTTEAGRAQQDALEGIASALNTQFVQAFDAANGSQQDFIASATEIGDTTMARLTEQLGLSSEQAAELATALGLTEGDYEARFNLSADQVAIERLGLLQSAIAGLPPEVSTVVNTQIAAGDPQAALFEIMAFYSDPANFAEIGTSVNVADAQAGISEVTDGEYEVGFSPTFDPTAVEDGLDDLEQTAEDNPVTVTAEAETTDAEGDLDTVADPRTAPFDINIVEYVIALALMAAIAAPRTANITANALTAVANIELNNVARDRTAAIDAFLRNVPSESALISRMTGGRGYIRIPVDTYPRNVARLGAAR